MEGKLFVVEGASGSGKNTLLEHLAQLGHDVLRGVPSQNHPENQYLNQRSKEILGESKVSLKLMLEVTTLQRQDIVSRYTKIVQSQLQDAIERKYNGKIVFLNRSVISLNVHLILLYSKFKKEDVITVETEKILADIQIELIKELNGIILMKFPRHRIEKEGIAGLQHEESKYINLLVGEISNKHNIPVLKLNANEMSIEEEISQVKQFIQKAYKLN